MSAQERYWFRFKDAVVVFRNDWASWNEYPRNVRFHVLEANFVWYSKNFGEGCKRREICLGLLGFRLAIVWYK